MSPRAMLIGRVVIGSVRVTLQVMPARLRRALEDRIFYGIFNVTRVMNDSYGWRPEEPAGYSAPHSGVRDEGIR